MARLRSKLRSVEEDFRRAMAARDNLAGQVATLTAKLEDARDALGRFAVSADQMGAYVDETEVLVEITHPRGGLKLFLRVENFRKAREAVDA